MGQEDTLAGAAGQSRHNDMPLGLSPGAPRGGLQLNRRWSRVTRKLGWRDRGGARCRSRARRSYAHRRALVELPRSTGLIVAANAQADCGQSIVCRISPLDHALCVKTYRHWSRQIAC
jgi:hypothetical protein